MAASTHSSNGEMRVVYLLTVRFAYALSLFVVLAACIPQEAPPDTQSNSTEVPADAATGAHQGITGRETGQPDGQPSRAQRSI